MENTIINKMLNNSLKNCILFKVKEGNLVIGSDANILVLNEGKMHQLTYVPYENMKGDNINKKTREKIAEEFINKYKYSDIVKIYEDKQKEKIEKIEKAETNKEQLVELLKKYEYLKEYGKLEIYANNNIISYYLEFRRNHNYLLEIYPSENGIYNIRYNYDNKKVNFEELNKLIITITNNIKNEIEKQEIEKQKEIENTKCEQNKEEFARKILKGEIAIIKLKSSFQCLRNGLRYTVGKGEGKYYNLNTAYDIVKYLNKKEIKEYAFISSEELKNISLKQLKELNYRKF